MSESLRAIFERIESRRPKRVRSERDFEASRRSSLKKSGARDATANRPRPTSCEICGGNKQRIAFDHCHVSGLFRGWLCGRCNTVLGAVGDDPALLQGLAQYLGRHARSA